MSDAPQPNDDRDAIERATRLTTDSIRQLIEAHESSSDPAVSQISVAERNELIEEVSRIIPAGNVVNFVFSGIIHARGRETIEINAATGRSHMNALFKGLSMMRDNMFYQLAFAGPATILAGYNMLLQLAGADPAKYLPEGAWQFYVEFGLREDAAHHQNETIAFQNLIASFRRAPDEAIQLSAWVLSVMSLIKDYEQLMALQWEELVRLEAIEETTGLTNLHREWQKVRPYSAPDLETNLVAYRQQRFEEFCNYYLSTVSESQWQAFSNSWFNPEIQDERGRQARAYVRQLSIYRNLIPGEYSDERYPIRPEDLHVGIIYKDNYYLIPIVNPETPEEITHVVQTVQNILRNKVEPLAEIDRVLVTTPRNVQLRVRGTLNREQQDAITRLHSAPIFINWDKANRNQPLTMIRNGRRGIGDHALTLFRTDSSMVFDFSHIFFDGPWAMAIAEMLTNEAMKYLHIGQNQSVAPNPQAITPLNLKATTKFLRTISKYPQHITHISAEVSRPIEPLQQLRRVIQARTGLRITINDLLVLYRTIFNQYYQPSDALQKALKRIAKDKRSAVLARNIDNMISTKQTANPSLLIPIDATRYDPKERIFPSPFRSPLPNFRAEHETLLQLRQSASQRKLFGQNKNSIQQFLEERQRYVGYLQAFGELMQRYREIAVEGNSMGTMAIRLIAGLPEAMQQLMDEIPGNLSVVNEAIKGEEVFSNVGRVVQHSSIIRFASAKDDNDKKVLVWGIMTDDDNTLYITLRDFRPPVLDLVREGHEDIALLVTQDFLNAYMDGLYRFAEEMGDIISTSVKKRS